MKHILATLLFVFIPLVLKDIRKSPQVIKDQEMRKWEKTRKKGKGRYILDYTLIWTISFVTITWILEAEFTWGHVA
ncbi:hypothetical protein [Pontibacillus yanchengensis]|uniref:hypothetical protein n=1 Tax=Pontibacillus yanchengensis TaxID=462910 RepID=UPI00136A30F0|nr:hypothetical protein [Pontibacillus yanchengensis]